MFHSAGGYADPAENPRNSQDAYGGTVLSDFDVSVVLVDLDCRGRVAAVYPVQWGSLAMRDASRRKVPGACVDQ